MQRPPKSDHTTLVQMFKPRRNEDYEELLKKFGSKTILRARAFLRGLYQSLLFWFRPHFSSGHHFVSPFHGHSILRPGWLSRELIFFSSGLAPLPPPVNVAEHIRMYVQPDIGYVVKMFAGNEPDDLADRAFGIVAGHTSKSLRVDLFIFCQFCHIVQ